MLSHAFPRISGSLLVLALAACADSTSPIQSLAPAAPSNAGGIPHASAVGNGLGGGSASATPCGSLSTAINAYTIVVYTTRIGIGLSGTATNCGARKVAFEVDVTDTNTNPACAIAMPHFISARNTDPGLSMSWVVNSTLVHCLNQTHTFNVRLWDTKTGQTLANTTASAFL